MAECIGEERQQSGAARELIAPDRMTANLRQALRGAGCGVHEAIPTSVCRSFT